MQRGSGMNDLSVNTQPGDRLIISRVRRGIHGLLKGYELAELIRHGLFMAHGPKH